MILIYNAKAVVRSEVVLCSVLLETDKFVPTAECKIYKLEKQNAFYNKAPDNWGNVRFDRVYDFDGDYLFPCFVDMHCHSEFYYMNNPASDLRRRDFICAEVAGNCGVSAFPLSADKEKAVLLKQQVLSILGEWPKDADGRDLSWGSFADFQKVFNSFNPVNKVYFLQGHSALRIAAMEGNPNRKATGKEIEIMCSLLDQSICEGALGFSTGLYYAPCVFSDENELVELLKVVRRHNGIFAIHRREEGNHGFESTAEAIDLARRTGVRLQISHLKAVGMKNQNQVDGILELIDKAAAEGIDIAFDQYPYTFGSTSLQSLLPPSVTKYPESVWKEKLRDRKFRYQAEYDMMHPVGFESITELVGFDNVYVQSSDTFPQYRDRSFIDIAAMEGRTPADVFFDILCDETGACTMRDTVQGESDMLKILAHPLSLYGTDALFAGSVWHPRGTEASHHILANYADKVGISHIVSRATWKPAERLGLKEDYIIREGATLPLVRWSGK